MSRLSGTLANIGLLGLVVLASASLSPDALLAQTTPAKPAASESSSVGFSIETEMLTYRALESNGEAIACEVAAYLHGTTPNFKNPPPGSVCNVTGPNSAINSGVIVLPFDRSVYSDFQIWRSDMQTMAEIVQRGAAACKAPPTHTEQPATPPGVSGRGLTAGSAAGAIGMISPYEAAATGVLGLFASDHSSSPVGGTIQDQAFMDDVSRELRADNVAVLMPSDYSPYALTSIDASRSPFLIALDKLLHTRDCLVASKGASDSDVKNIDEFLASLTSSSSPAKTPAAQPSGSSTASGGTAGAPSPPASPPSHLDSVLSADSLAQRLGADPQTGKVPENAPQHVLLIKALESGGSVGRSSNIFGTKTSYSGGSVGTYALFGLNGELECSGNVYDYTGAIPAKGFQKQLQNYVPDPSRQVIFSRGGCKAQ